MASATTQDVSFRVDDFVHYTEDMLKSLKEGDHLPSIPTHLETIVKSHLFYNVNKPVIFPKLPENTQMIDMLLEPTQTIKKISQFVYDDTNGFIDQIDPQSEDFLKDPNFHYLLMNILYLKAHWDGYKDKSYDFHNANGTIKKNVPFFYFSEIEPEIVDGIFSISVPYITQKPSFMSFVAYEEASALGDVVRFSKPLSDPNEEYDSNAKVHLPKLTVDTTLTVDDGFKEGRGGTVLQLKYKQDEKGFEATCISNMSGGGLEKPIKHVYFDEPFKIEIFSKNQKVMEIDVNNL